MNAFATVFVALLTYSSFSEFYTIAIKKDIDQYPFGSECAPSYYETPDLYADVMLASGCFFGILMLFQVINWKKQLLSGYSIFIITLIVFIVEQLFLRLF
ncbi:MAG: hypothetical protein ROO71_07690 [Balneola sp.]